MSIRKYLRTQFRSFCGSVQNDGTITSGTAGETNGCVIDGIPWELFVIGTQTTLLPTFLASANSAGAGLAAEMTNTNGQGWALTPFCNHSRSRLSFVIGTDPAFFVKLKVRCADYSGCNPLAVGFKATAAGTAMQAHTGTWADYTDKATIGVTAGGGTSGDVQIVTALNNAAADTTTDTTDNINDTVALTLKVLVSASGVVTYQHDVAAPGTLAAPTSVASFTFDSGDYAVPFIYFVEGADVSGNLELLEFECGHQ